MAVSSADFKDIDRGLVKVYHGIIYLEQTRLAQSEFKDLTIKEMHAIEAISMYHRHTISEVAKMLHLTPGTMTAMVDRLIYKGYVERVRDKNDRRVIRLKLTNHGRVFYRAHQVFHKMMVKEFLNGMNDQEVKDIKQAIQSLERFLDEQSLKD